MRSYEQYCALARALDHVGQRWTLLIVRELLSGPKRFTDLRAGLPGIASNLLADRLRQLQTDGLVRQYRLPAPAASTVYELTQSGHGLREPIEALIRWGGRWMTRGPDGDAFRPDWLALALDALGLGDRAADGTTVDVEVEGETVRLAIINARVTTRPHGGPADLSVKGDASALLGLAAGALPPDAALQAVKLSPEDAGTVSAFLRMWLPVHVPRPAALAD